MTAPILRPYQQRAIEAIFAGWDAGLQRVAISAATGAGKSVIFGEVARRHLHHHRDKGPVVLLAHRKELITQAAAHFKRANPDLRVEVVIGSPGPAGSTRRAKAVRNWKRADVLCTSVQTLASAQTMHVFPDPSLAIADESHHAAADSWRRVLTALGCWTATRALGVTATPFREDHRDFSDIWQRVVAAIDISWLIGHRLDEHGVEVECAPGEGYLVPPTLRHLIVDGLDLSSVPTSRKGGAVDFREGELADEMERAGAFDAVAKTVLSELGDRRGVIFAPTVASSIYLAETLTNAGAPCGHVDGTMKPADRDDVLARFRAGTIRWLSNVGIVSEGFDLPEIDSVVLARPTQSRIFFRQAIGRALRPAPGKTEAIVLDVAGASDGHSLAGVEALTDDDVLNPDEGEGLTELLERSARERQGRIDRITAHLSDARSVQQRGELAAEQVRLTVDGLADQLPGLVAFADQVPPRLSEVQDHSTRAADRALAATPEMTLDELGEIEQRCAEGVADARRTLGNLEAIKVKMREALAALKEDPGGEVARAMITGRVGTVRGELFGEQEERAKPSAPSSAGKLRVRGAAQDDKPVHPGRFGWAMRSDTGAYFCLVHGEAPPPNGPTGMGGRSEPTAMTVAVPIVRSGVISYLPIWWDVRTGEASELGDPVDDEQAYRQIVEVASDHTHAPNLLHPAARWRTKTAQSGGARALAMRLAPGTDIPDNATAGYVSDVITYAKHAANVDRLVAWVQQQMAS